MIIVLIMIVRIMFSEITNYSFSHPSSNDSSFDTLYTSRFPLPPDFITSTSHCKNGLWILNIPTTSILSEIQKTYHKLVKLYHPDEYDHLSDQEIS